MNHVRIVVFAIVSLMQACAGKPQPVAPAAPTPSVAPEARAGVAANSLLARAEAQRAAGDWPAAASSLERALRMEPGNAWLWNRLARLRLEQGHYAQAQSLAAKSNALAGDAVTLRQDNQAIIFAARQAGGV
jgi:tetratricopeptide (TPR) repeat protein